MKTFFIITAALVLTMLGGCVSSGPDYTPIGDGLKAIGIALVVFGVVRALADLIRSGESPPGKPKQSKPRRPRGFKPTERR